jgi:prepilin signal peptidase PulO-like enzyme (type II secretory pathway)
MKTDNLQTLENLKPEAAKNGIGFGLIALILGVISSYVLVSTTSLAMIFISPIVISVIVPIIIAIFFARDLRKKIGGYWNLRQATSGMFIMFLVSYVISVSGNFIFNKLIEKDMTSRIQTSVVNASLQLMKNQGASEEEVDKKESEMNAEFEKKTNGTFMQTVQGHLIGVIIIFVVSLIFGAAFRKDPPLAFGERLQD